MADTDGLGHENGALVFGAGLILVEAGRKVICARLFIFFL